MLWMMLKLKIYCVMVICVDLYYVGLVIIDVDLMDVVDLLEGEQVIIVDIDNGV